MKISHNWLQSYFKDKLPKPEKLAEILTTHSFEVESVEKNGKDRILEIGVLPNRAHDCLSHFGIAREVAALLNIKLKTPAFAKASVLAIRVSADKSAGRQNSKPQLKTKNLNIKNYLKIDVRERELCPRYAAMAITDVKIGPSPSWIQERLAAIGQKPINNIVDATNYVMFELGQPLHAFDFDKLEAVNLKPQLELQNLKEIIIKRANNDEKIITLEGETFNLNNDVLVIADSKEPIAIAGIKGGKKAEITDKTKNIILEAANFEPINIRKTSKRLGLRTESSMRFEYELDINLASVAMGYLTSIIKNTAGGNIAEGIIDIYPKKVYPKIIKLDLGYVKSLLGAEIAEKEIKKILEGLGLKLKTSAAQKGKNEKEEKTAKKLTVFDVEVPTSRLDINIPEDIIEEISRIYGYEKIPSSMPVSVLMPVKKEDRIFWKDRIGDVLKGLGLAETMNYSLSGKLSSGLFENAIFEIENPINPERKYLRPSLIFGLLQNIKNNENNFGSISLFEFGKIFQRNDSRNNSVVEKENLAVILARNEINLKNSAELFYEAKGIIDNFLQSIGISDIWYDDFLLKDSETLLRTLLRQNHDFSNTFKKSAMLKLLNSKISAQIKIGNNQIGWVGEIFPKLKESLGIKSSLAFFEIDFDKLSKLASEEQEYRPISKYPEVVRDIAILVPNNARVSDVLNKIETAGGKIVRDIDIFDMYEGDGLPEEKKSLAFHIIFQSEDRTLTSKDVDNVMERIIEDLEKEMEWDVRR